MARRTHRQVDPFNAGDPIMPSDELGQEYVPISPEGEWVSPEGQGSADGHGCWVDDAPKAPRKPGQGSAGSRSGKQRQSKARTSTAKASKPASRAASAARPKGSRQSTAQSAGRTMGRTFRKSFVVLIAIALVVEMGGALTSCADTLFDGLEDAGYGVTHAVSAIFGGPGATSASGSLSSPNYESSSSESLDFNTYTQVCNELEGQESGTVRQLMGRISSGDAGVVSKVATYLDDAFQSYSSDMTLEGIGVDSKELARWCLTNVSYSEDDIETYAYSTDGSDTAYTGAAYLYIQATDTLTLVSELSAYVRSDLLDYGNMPEDGLTENQRALVAKRLEELKQADVPTTRALSFEFKGRCEPDGSNPQATLDEDAWNADFANLFGSYS